MKRNIVIYGGLFAIAMLLFNLTALAAAEKEMTLNDSIQLAVANNRDVKAALQDREVAYWRLLEVKANRFPVLNLTHTDTRVKPDPSDPVYRLMGGITPPETSHFENKLTVSLPLYTGGQLSGSIRQLELYLQMADANVNKAKHQAKLDVTVAYYNVLRARSMVKLCGEAVAGLNAHLKNVKALADVGLVTKNNVLRTEVAVADAAENLIKAQNGYDLALANLNYILGLPLAAAVTVKEDLSYVKFDDTLEECSAGAFQNRPEIAVANLNCEMAQKGIDVAKSGYLPTISLAGVADWNDTEFPGAKNDNWSLNLISSWKLNSGGQTKAQINQAVAAREKAVEVAAGAREGIALEVRQAYLSLKEAEKRIQTGQLTVTKANEDVQIITARYQAGIATNLDVIDAQLALTQAKTNYLNSLYDYNVSLAKLQKAIGK